MRLSVRVVRDPVHDYVALSNLEAYVVDSPLFQRLRYITQNGLAHLTYPSNRTPRFTHSLGCMHIGGKLLLSALRNAPTATRNEFLDATRLLVEKALQDMPLDLARAEDFLRRSDDPFYRYHGLNVTGVPGSVDAKRSLTEIVLLQAVRIACAIHDVGHWPFSHTLESVLEAQASGPPPTAGTIRADFTDCLARLRSNEDHIAIHEAAGHKLMDRIFRKSLDEEKGLTFGLVCLHLAVGIIRSKIRRVEDPNSILEGLHQLVSSDFDADRADYVQRDGLASGFEFGAYDLDRIVRSMQLVKRDTRFLVRPSVLALSALESFFLERLRIYRWLVYHHSVVRSDLALQRALGLLFQVYFDGAGLPEEEAEPLKKRLREAEFERLWKPFRDAESLDRYWACDENWLLSLFMELLDSQALSGERKPLALLRVYLAAVCNRQKGFIRSLWKRLEEYRAFAEQFQNEARKATFNGFFDEAANQSLRAARDKEAVPFLNAVLSKQLSPAGPGDTRPWGGHSGILAKFEQEVEDKWGTALNGRENLPGKLLFSHTYQLKPGPTTFYLNDPADPGRDVDLCALSTLVRNLEDVWHNDIQAFGFIVCGRAQDNSFQEDRQQPFEASRCRKMVAEAAAATLLDVGWRLEVGWRPGAN